MAGNGWIGLKFGLMTKYGVDLKYNSIFSNSISIGIFIDIRIENEKWLEWVRDRFGLIKIDGKLGMYCFRDNRRDYE